MPEQPHPRRAHPAAPDTVVIHGLGEKVVVMPPNDAREILFGRNRPYVHLCVGEDDPAVSRYQGILTFGAGRWWLANIGTNLAIQVGGSRRLYPQDEPVSLAEGYTSLVVVDGKRPHPLEVFVTGANAGRAARHGEPTRPVRAWDLDAEERFAVVVLAQDYLRHEPNPQPVSWKRAAELMAEIEPRRGWTDKRVEHLVRDLRLRLAGGGVAGLQQAEVGGFGQALKHNLIKELVATNTISPRDLVLIDADADADTQRHVSNSCRTWNSPS